MENRESIISTMNEYSLPCLVVEESETTANEDEEDLKNMRCGNMDELGGYAQLMIEASEKMKQRC